MAIQDLWKGRDGKPTRRAGTGKRWRVTVDGHPTKAFAIKDDAREHERRLLATSPERGARAEVEVRPLVAEYLEGKQHLTRDSINALRAGAAHVLTRFGDSWAADIDAQDVQVWISNLTAQHGPRRADGTRGIRPAAAATKAKAVQVLRSSLDIAVRRGQLQTNPAEDIDCGRPGTHDAVYLTVDQLRALAGVVEGQDRAMIWLFGTCGPRMGEAVALDVGDADRQRGRLRIRRSKNGQARDIPLTPLVLAELDLDRAPTAPLFRAPRGARVDGDNWRARVFGPAVQAAGLPSMRVHDLRHTAASLMIASGASIKDVQYALGHKSAKMTLDLYGHRFEGHLADVARRMAELIG